VIVGGYSGHVVALERGTGTIRWVSATGNRIIGGAAW
jgi:outer membrane protein assembly factor BamB